jgi:hypothetical protein
MSMIRPNGNKVMLPRGVNKQQWDLITRHYAKTDARKWKYMAMLALKENAGWPLECIGLVFKHPKGHVSRCIARVKRELQIRFSPQERIGIGSPHDDEQVAA